MVRSFLDQSEGELHALRIQLNGGSPVAPSFELTLVDPTRTGTDDVEIDGGGFTSSWTPTAPSAWRAPPWISSSG
jgi:hypothetical protein